MGIYQEIISRMSIEKGWSGDRKYCAITIDGGKYLLRISPLEKHDRRKREFDKMCEVAALTSFLFYKRGCKFREYFSKSFRHLEKCWSSNTSSRES